MKAEKKKCKADRVREHLMKYGNISSIEAFTQYNVTRLADLVFQLRKKNWIINSKDESYTNKDGITSNFVRYELISDAEGNAFKRKISDIVCDEIGHLPTFPNSINYDTRQSEQTVLVKLPAKYKKLKQEKEEVKMGDVVLKPQNLF